VVLILLGCRLIFFTPSNPYALNPPRLRRHLWVRRLGWLPVRCARSMRNRPAHDAPGLRGNLGYWNVGPALLRWALSMRAAVANHAARLRGYMGHRRVGNAPLRRPYPMRLRASGSTNPDAERQGLREWRSQAQAKRRGFGRLAVHHRVLERGSEAERQPHKLVGPDFVPVSAKARGVEANRLTCH
jgi:hypothetical protein